MKLLCKLVTNPLKPMVCAHPINLCNSLGSGLSDLHQCVGCSRGPWLESVIKFPFLPVALSWRPSLFLLGDSDIGHNNINYLEKKPYMRFGFNLSQYSYLSNTVHLYTIVLTALCKKLVVHFSHLVVSDFLGPHGL